MLHNGGEESNEDGRGMQAALEKQQVQPRA